MTYGSVVGTDWILSVVDEDVDFCFHIDSGSDTALRPPQRDPNSHTTGWMVVVYLSLLSVPSPRSPPASTWQRRCSWPTAGRL